MQRWIIGVVSVLSAALLLAPMQTFAQTNPAQVQVLHRAPGIPDVDVFVDGTRVLQNVSFGADSDRFPVAPGSHRIQVAPAGAAPESAVIDTTALFKSGVPYTIIALNGGENLEALVLRDTLRPLAGNRARLRIVHAAPDAPVVDVRVTGAPAPVLTNQYYKSADYIDVDAGTYKFDLLPAGSSQAVATSQDLRLEPGWTYTVVVTRAGEGSGQPLLFNTSIDQTSG